LGLRIRRGCSFHGLSINVDMDMEPFQRINPCGYAGLEMVQMLDLTTRTLLLSELQDVLCSQLLGLLGQPAASRCSGLPVTP